MGHLIRMMIVILLGTYVMGSIDSEDTAGVVSLPSGESTLYSGDDAGSEDCIDVVITSSVDFVLVPYMKTSRLFMLLILLHESQHPITNIVSGNVIGIAGAYQVSSMALQALVSKSDWIARRLLCKTISDWRNHLVQFTFDAPAQLNSFVHSTVVSIVGLSLFLSNTAMHANRITGAPDTLMMVLLTHSIGYFLSDLLDMIRHPSGPDWTFITHHLLALSALGYVATTGCFAYFALVCLLFELSTPFLVLQWMLSELNIDIPVLVNFISMIFGVVFIAVRTIFGMSTSYQLAADDLAPLLATGPSGTLFSGGIIMAFFLIAFNALNLIFLVFPERGVFATFKTAVSRIVSPHQY